jgi:hypothetical protein
MVNDFTFYNLGLVIAILTLLGIQIGIFLKSQKPLYRQPQNWGSFYARRTGEPMQGGPLLSDFERKQIMREARTRYNKEWTIYTLVYVLPIIFATLSIFSILNFNIGLIFFIVSFVLTLIEVIAIKYFDIGVSNNN